MEQGKQTMGPRERAAAITKALVGLKSIDNDSLARVAAETGSDLLTVKNISILLGLGMAEMIGRVKPRR